MGDFELHSFLTLFLSVIGGNRIMGNRTTSSTYAWQQGFVASQWICNLLSQGTILMSMRIRSIDHFLAGCMYLLAQAMSNSHVNKRNGMICR